MKRFFITVLLFAGIFIRNFGGEGLWNPLLVDSLNYSDMVKNGLRLGPEEIFSLNHSSLKDAVVLFGGGCTGEIISPEGLLITNHHCGYSRIQSHSTLENNYLKDGFWAQSRSDELPNPGLSVSFLVRIEDVTEKVLINVPAFLSETERSRRTAYNSSLVENEAVSGSGYEAEVNTFYFGSKYYLFVYEVFHDIRLVGAPPEAIGRFGGDTDNWMWPRHTGDFSLFRVYAGKDNKPAAYAPENIPYKPKKYFNISTEGIREGDFTMVIGYPARTDEYLTSDGLEMITEKSLPAKIEMRAARLAALEQEMSRGPAERLKLSSKYVSISNSWKKWIGVTKGVERTGAISKKKQNEEDFTKLASRASANITNTADIMENFKQLYAMFTPVFLANDIGSELLNSVDLFNLIARMQSDLASASDSTTLYKKKVLSDLWHSGKNYFASHSNEMDKKILPVLLKTYAAYTEPGFYPSFYGQLAASFNTDYNLYVNSLFAQSVLTDSVRLRKLLKKPVEAAGKKLMADPLVKMYRDFIQTLVVKTYGRTDSLNRELNGLYREYVSALKVLYPDQLFYPDANFTMRVSYGRVEGYRPADAVSCLYYSTLDGIIEKEDPDVMDYQVPEKLKQLYADHDFGTYQQAGKVPVCFIASNHTSGGNSGSPVLNADGNLIGINFDRNWEGTVSDYVYDPKVCRNISLDIRYVLFIIDKVADADWLLQEMTLVSPKTL